MIVSIITAAGLVVYTMIWPDGSMVACNKTITGFVIENSDTLGKHDVKAWCATYPTRPELGSQMSRK